MIGRVDEVHLGCGPVDENLYYRDGAQDLIRRLVPRDLLEAPVENLMAARVRFQDLLPFFAAFEPNYAPGNYSFLLLCKYRQNACLFFYEMVSRWLLPQRKINVELFFASDVRLPHLSEDLLSVAEIVIQIKSNQELQEVQRNLRQIETEVKLGVASHYHARRILEFKGLSVDGKTAMIQEKIGSLIQSRCKEYDRGIFSQMQHFLVTCHDEFKKIRDYHHITRIISNLYSVRKLLMQNFQTLPAKRHVILKFLKTRLVQAKQQKCRSVLGILAGMNFLQEREIFEQQHLIDAIARYIPNVRPVEQSFFADRAGGNAIQTNYLEIEKDDGSEFTHEEIQHLREHLPSHLQTHVEQLAQPMFMPRNEEEVLRNIMALSRQLRFVTDLPQLIISFEEQRGGELCFTVILLRVVAPGEASVGELFAKAKTDLTILPDRVRRLGNLGRKHQREATVFRAIVKSKPFIRADHSVDLYRARQYMVSELTRCLGELRDYNGGMIGKQSEVLSSLKNLLGKVAEREALLLEKFFFSLTPVELRSVMDAEQLKQLFLLLLQAKKCDADFRKKKMDWFFRQEDKRVYVAIPRVAAEFKGKALEALKQMSLSPYQLISFTIEFHDVEHIGFLLQSDEPMIQKQFLECIEQSLDSSDLSISTTAKIGV